MALSKSEQKKLLRTAKKISPLTICLAIAFLLVGIGTGYLAVSQVCKNDCIELIGQKELVFTVASGTAAYTDEGVKAVTFGQDISKDVVITYSNDLTVSDATYVIDLTEEGEYYIKYTFNHFKFGTVVKYRTILVELEEVAS